MHDRSVDDRYRTGPASTRNARDPTPLSCCGHARFDGAGGDQRQSAARRAAHGASRLPDRDPPQPQEERLAPVARQVRERKTERRPCAASSANSSASSYPLLDATARTDTYRASLLQSYREERPREPLARLRIGRTLVLTALGPTASLQRPHRRGWAGSMRSPFSRPRAHFLFESQSSH